MRSEALVARQDKASLRREFISARKSFALSAGQTVRSALEAGIHRLICDLATPTTQIALYRPMPGEANFNIEPATSYFFPVLNGEQMELRRPLRTTAFIRNQYEIEEPDPKRSEALAPDKPVLIFSPAVVVDWQGNRIGMGKGYYDRFFTSLPQAIRVGVVFQIQLTKEPLPADSWDQTLDWIVTEKMILRTRPAKRSS